MRLLIFGLGYTGRAVGLAARARESRVVATIRSPTDDAPFPTIAFDDAASEIATATHCLCTAPPGDAGDPVLARYGCALERASGLRWIGYFSTTGVYGDRAGGTVDERTPPQPASARARRRIEAETAFARLANAARAIDLIRLAGIYGPGRSVLDDVRAGTARPIRAPGHAFGRIHRDDIAEGVLAAIDTARPGQGARVLNFTDDEPAETADVIAYAAALLGLKPPPERSLEAAWPTMSPMARSFWSDNRRVEGRATQAALRRPWRYPTYRDGLRAVMTAEQVLQ